MYSASKISKLINLNNFPFVKIHHKFQVQALCLGAIHARISNAFSRRAFLKKRHSRKSHGTEKREARGERKERPTTTESLRRRQGREMLSFIKRKIGSCLSECNISTDSFGGNISSSGKNSIKSRRWEVVSEGNGQGCRRYGGVQTRKRRLRSKIDREIGTESLDAKIRYS